MNWSQLIVGAIAHSSSIGVMFCRDNSLFTIGVLNEQKQILSRSITSPLKSIPESANDVPMSYLTFNYFISKFIKFVPTSCSDIKLPQLPFCSRPTRIFLLRRSYLSAVNSREPVRRITKLSQSRFHDFLHKPAVQKSCCPNWIPSHHFVQLQC